MLWQRLLLGPILLLALFTAFWMDGVLDAARIPQAWRPALGDRETFPPGVAIFLIALAVSPFASYELAAILRANDIRASKRITWAASVAGLVVSCTIPAGIHGVDAVALVSSTAILTLLLALLFYTRGHTVEGVAAAAGGALLTFVYLGLMFGFVLAMRRDHSEWVVLGVLVVTKSCDIGAYFTGRALGRRKLIPWLSPGKTWEGLVGGVILASALGALGVWLMRRLPGEPVLPLALGAAAGAALAIAGQAGDLIASLLKRDAGIKDSSRVLPGFGGVLDVIDSPLLAAPVAFWLLRALGG